ncbi:hypothetical protein T4B_10744 [Trichinella pseudospiralis]|uniref:Uncharacterized protein n=1 Tax=Trichinella pseudospiralis TaxID=6337 RepID=A0A0V1IC00_TRIPS|nr:hypothetical protein T4B_10744 [Trichinella pseudospiralis]
MQCYAKRIFEGQTMQCFVAVCQSLPSERLVNPSVLPITTTTSSSSSSSSSSSNNNNNNNNNSRRSISLQSISISSNSL